MIVVRLMGGLGNQMFQYAIAKTLAIKNNVEVGLDLTFLEKKNKNTTKRDFELGIFGIKKEQAPHIYTRKRLFDQSTLNFFQRLKNLILSYQINYVYYEKLMFNPQLLKVKSPAYLIGYFQSENFFIENKDLIQSLYDIQPTPSPYFQTLGEECKKNNSVSLHIRRKDYIGSIHEVCDLSYYQQAISLVKEKVNNPLFIIFSDDISWCKANFKEDNFIFVTNETGKDYEDMRLMTICKHNITANSSFSWWGAWLNKNKDKIVICPNQWFKKGTLKTDIIPTDWEKIHVY